MSVECREHYLKDRAEIKTLQHNIKVESALWGLIKCKAQQSLWRKMSGVARASRTDVISCILVPNLTDLNADQPKL